ncbi:TIGR02588 family protein [Laspinema sp. D1]|uniref:TIGR02588 family protein n=1 Tax=Laspinema palackyanum TaxID=3231601 RepID=UPI003490A131|nr:TIGR02588 family protein [Laspinema sp. D2b]
MTSEMKETQSKQTQQNDRRRQEIAGRSPAEWVTFSIALSIVAILIGLVSYDWMTQGDRPPILSVTPKGQIQERNQQFYVPFRVQNEGGETVASVQVIAELEIDGITYSIGEQEIEFLAKGETEEGAFVSNRDPRQGKLTMRVSSYKLP